MIWLKVIIRRQQPQQQEFTIISSDEKGYLTGVGLTTTILGLICVFCLYSFYLKIFKVPSVSSIIEH